MCHVTSYSELNSNMHVDKLVLCVCERSHGVSCDQSI